MIRKTSRAFKILDIVVKNNLSWNSSWFIYNIVQNELNDYKIRYEDVKSSLYYLSTKKLIFCQGQRWVVNKNLYVCKLKRRRSDG